MSRKTLLLFALGILAVIIIFICFRMDILFVEGAVEAFVVGLALGLVLGIILAIWIFYKIDAHEDERKTKA